MFRKMIEEYMLSDTHISKKKAAKELSKTGLLMFLPPMK
jgi:hypothetical protein